MTQSFCDDKENIDTARAEVMVLRDRLARVQRQYDSLVQQKSAATDTAEHNRRIQQLMIENERLAHLIKQTETSKNDQISNLVRSNAELQNKLIKLESSATSVVTTPPTMTTSDRITYQRIFSPTIQKNLIEKFFRVKNPPQEWEKIRDCVLANTDSSRGTILQTLISTWSFELVKESTDFFRSIIVAMSKVPDPQFIVLRDRLADRLGSDSLSPSSIIQLSNLLSVLPTEAFFDRKDIRSIFTSVCKTLKNSPDFLLFRFLRRCVTHASSTEVAGLQSFPSGANIFITVSELLKPKNSKMIDTESLSESQLKSQCVQLVVSGVLKTRDIVALMNLRNDSHGSEKTLGQRIFHLLFNELLRESRLRHFPEKNFYDKFLPSRTEIIRGCWFCLTRLGAVWSDSTLPVSESPLRECSLLVPSLLGLVRDLSANRSPETSIIDDVVCDRINDLIFLKELQDTVTGLEYETSLWTV